MKYFNLLILAISLPLIGFSSCEDDNTGKIVHIDKIDGRWIYNGLSPKVHTSFVLADEAIEKDIASRNKTSEFVLELTKDSKYIITDHTVLQDSGRYTLTGGKLGLTSKMLDSSYIESAPMFINNNDLTLTFDKTAFYSDSTMLDSLGITDPKAVTVYDAVYYYLFKRAM